MASSDAPSVQQMERFTRKTAADFGIDPNVAVKVARSEGLAPGVWQSNVVKGGKRETSFGPFQLLVGGGLGDKFKSQTGKSPRDKSTWREQIVFALSEASQGGWAPWYGAEKVGVDRWEGIDRGAEVDDTITASVKGVTTPSERLREDGAYEVESPRWRKTLSHLDMAAREDGQSDSGSGSSGSGSGSSGESKPEIDDGGPLAVVLGALDALGAGAEAEREEQDRAMVNSRALRSQPRTAPTIGSIFAQAGA